MADPVNTPVPESPTGTPFIPPAAFKYIALVATLALAVLGALMGLYPENPTVKLAFAVASALAGVLGIASPGLRKTTVIFALCCLPLLGGCASFGVWKADANSQAIKTIVYTCENVSPTDTAAQAAEAILATALEDAVSGAEGGVVGAVSKVLSDQGVKAYCMAAKLLALWEHGAATPVAPTAIQSMPSAVKASRLRSALSTLGVQFPK